MDIVERLRKRSEKYRRKTKTRQDAGEIAELIGELRRLIGGEKQASEKES